MVDASANTLHKAWRAGIDLASRAHEHPRLDSIARLEAEGRIYRTRTGSVRIKYNLETDAEGYVLEDHLIGDVWTDSSHGRLAIDVASGSKSVTKGGPSAVCASD